MHIPTLEFQFCSSRCSPYKKTALHQQNGGRYFRVRPHIGLKPATVDLRLGWRPPSGLLLMLVRIINQLSVSVNELFLLLLFDYFRKLHN